jgi:hypothetical protein
MLAPASEKEQEEKVRFMLRGGAKHLVRPAQLAAADR